jgi:NAD(P)-dependent dehydrogenase (short-subunit alcohol dehydrogenase family)
MTASFDLTGKTVVITGATSGLGRAAAFALARSGASLHLVGRDEQRAALTSVELARATGNRDIHMLVADLSVQAEVRRVADVLLAHCPRVDVLLNNAGAVQGFRRTTSVDGIEQTFALNHLAYFTLTLALLPRLLERAPARIVNVTGDAYKDAKGRFDFENYNASIRYRPIHQYAQSKLANILFTRELARRLDGTGVTVNAVGPKRTTATRFAHNVHPLAKVAMRLASPLLLAPAKGAAPIVTMCAAPEVAGTNGAYWCGAREAELEPAATNDDDAARLWDLSTELTGLTLHVA